MLHPDTELRSINPSIGHGVFATTFIPMGSIVYVKDAMEIIVREEDTLFLDRRYRDHIEKYSYTEADGCKVLSWDLAKYVNHACESNTLSTGYGFEIAIRDIHKGQQVTDDYGMLNIEHVMPCHCGSLHCRQHIGLNDFADCSDDWDRKVKIALMRLNHVSQPLLDYLSPETYVLLELFLNNNDEYHSVRYLERRLMQDHVA